MAGFQLTQTLVQALRQEQVMAPHQIQALEILLATIPELEQRITAELVENPTLELLESAGQSLAGNPVEGEQGEAAREDAATAAEKDEALATLIAMQEDWRDHATPRAATDSYSSDDVERRQHFFDSLTVERTLQEELQEQLREVPGLDGKMLEICAQVVGSIDERGYLCSHPSDLAITANAELAEIERGIEIVQGFEPAGIGARDLRECLLLQLRRQDQVGTLVWRLVDEFLEEVGRNQIPKVAKDLGIRSGEVYELLGKVRDLDPFPGSRLASVPTDYVCPEVFVEWNEAGELVVRGNREYRPRLRISPHYLKLLEEPDTPSDVKKYIREKVMGSKLLLRAIDQRESTIVRIAESILEHQRDFFTGGAKYLRPMVMAEVAEDVGVHETTVSRAIAGKYMQTPHGLVTFRQFFSAGYQGDGGEEVSAVGIKSKIQSMIDGEAAKKPLSDQKLANLLKEQGFKVARRTVAKYREELGIAPSHLRRSY
ncbi:MAG: RNA polymerase factor sigma-54 [Victivallales bacterium]|nr:RNA polymerase factor sigma-54 [Victivallales bacterium]